MPPIGYHSVDAEQRGAKMKKKLEIDPLHADTIRLIYRLALEGEGSSGQMGVKAIVNHLNKRRMFTRNGGRWGIGQLHRVLTWRTYIGEHRFNRRSKKGEVKPEEEIVTVPVPPPRVVSGLNLLTGICHCGDCGGAMTLRSGKNGRCRYLCLLDPGTAERNRLQGPRDPMDKLDRIVVSHIEERLRTPSGLKTFSPRCWIAGRRASSGAASTLPS
ncbi:MAG: hypothetical protein ABS35_06195 [Kaistia sp. SCN 65-12]|nr:MAG: hypothetical protein ABS35_06195 [Kaistia sp. SCN 65-12]